MRKRKADDPKPSTDSFIDVICNTTGVLIIMLLFAAVFAGARLIGWHKEPEIGEKRIHTFEVRGSSVCFIDRPALMEKANAELQQLKTLSEDERLARLAEVEIRHGPYTLVPGSLLVGALTLTWDGGGGGGTPVEELARPDSEFRRVLDTLDPEKDMLFFVVRVDGWQTFLRAKRIARGRGFQARSEIRENESPITFLLSGGRALLQPSK
ncbi:MAG: hypothetical protein JXR37_26115 [Kiritimatiellae bacterium]|nr:hypothetical protein [Kiritimatiellia bacterium]